MTPIYRNRWLWAFLIGVTVVTLTRPLLRRIPSPPPVLAQLPPFSLVDAGGGDFGPADLERGVWILAFFSTSGESTCAGLLESMHELGRRYDEAGVEDVLLLGIAAEPAGTTAEVLGEFAETRGLAPPRWSLVTGDPDEIRRLAGALLEAIGESPGPEGFQGGVPRPCRLFLVDGSGGIRGGFPDDKMGLDEILHRAQHVARATAR